MFRHRGLLLEDHRRKALIRLMQNKPKTSGFLCTQAWHSKGKMICPFVVGFLTRGLGMQLSPVIITFKSTRFALMRRNNKGSNFNYSRCSMFNIEPRKKLYLGGLCCVKQEVWDNYELLAPPALDDFFISRKELYSTTAKFKEPTRRSRSISFSITWAPATQSRIMVGAVDKSHRDVWKST